VAFSRPFKSQIKKLGTLNKYQLGFAFDKKSDFAPSKAFLLI